MFDWQTGEEKWDVVEEQLEPAEPAAPIPRSVPRWALYLIGILAIGAGVVALGLRWQSQRQTARLQADIQATLDSENWALQTHNLKLYRALLDPEADPGWLRRRADAFESADDGPPKTTVVDTILFGSDLAIAELKVDPPDEKPYLATRAFRRAGGMWLETSIPDGQVWVDQASRETENLRFVFHRRDAERVVSIIPAVEVLYAQLLDDLHLSPPQGKRTLYVILSVRPIESELPDDPTYYDLSDLAPDAGTQAVKRRLGALLLEQIVSLFRTERGDLSFLIRSVQEWEFADWLGLAIPGPQATSVQDLLVSLPFLTLTDESWKSLEYPTAEAVAGQVLVDYVVETYGRDKLADIVRGAQRYDNWYPFVTQALHVSQVLQVPFVEFDAGWRNHALHAFTRRKGTRLGMLASEKQELLRVLAAEKRAIEENNFRAYARLMSEHSDPEWQRQQRRLFQTYQRFRERTNAPFQIRLKDVITQRDSALVRVEIQFPDPGSVPFDEIRTYRLVDGEWKWTWTPASFWGLTHEEDAAHLRFRYNREDASVVEAEIPATEAFFLRLSHDLDLASRPGAWLKPRIGIDVEPHYRVVDWRGDEDEIQVLSPALGMIVSDMVRSNYYRMSTSLALSRYLITAHAGPAQTPFTDALYEAIARWETEQRLSLSPWSRPRRRALAEMLGSDVRPSLRGRPTWTERRVDPMLPYVYDTAIAYLTETYGRQRLGDVIQHASRHSSWASLIPAALDVDFDEFEAGWIDYVRLQVGRSEG